MLERFRLWLNSFLLCCPLGSPVADVTPLLLDHLDDVRPRSLGSFRRWSIVLASVVLMLARGLSRSGSASEPRSFLKWPPWNKYRKQMFLKENTYKSCYTMTKWLNSWRKFTKNFSAGICSIEILIMGSVDLCSPCCISFYHAATFFLNSASCQGRDSQILLNSCSLAKNILLNTK